MFMKNSHKSKLKSQLVSQIVLIPDNNGQIVNPSKKLEINLLVDPVGLSEPLKLCPIESVLLLDKKIKLESLLKTYFHVVVHVDPDVEEVIHHLLGIIIKIPDLSLEIFMELQPDVKLTQCHHVPIIPHQANTQLAHHLNTQHHHAHNNVILDLVNPGHLISTKDQALTQYPEKLNSKLKSRLMDQLKFLSLFTLISKLIPEVSINIQQDPI